MKKDYKNIRLALRQELPKLKADFNVSTLEVFGSYVRNEQKTDSAFGCFGDLFQGA